MAVLVVNSLKKSFNGLFKKNFEALRGIDFVIDEGVVFGLIGPNGAGKTTTIKSILNLVIPTSGSILIFGRDYRNKTTRKEIGYMPEIEKYPTYLTGRQFIYNFSKLSGISLSNCKRKFDVLLERTGLCNTIDKKIDTYSKGMKKKLGLIQAILHEPKLLLLDEPIEGLDAAGKKIVTDILDEYKTKGKSVLINSHYLSEVEKVCDVVSIIKQGKIVQVLDIKNKQLAKRGYIIGVSFIPTDLFEKLKKNFSVDMVENKDRGGTLILESDDEIVLNKLLYDLCNNNCLINRVEKNMNSLEDAYFSVVNS